VTEIFPNTTEKIRPEKQTEPEKASDRRTPLKVTWRIRAVPDGSPHPEEHFAYPKSPQHRSPIAQHSPHRPPFQIQYKSLLRIRSHDTIVKGPDDVRLKEKEVTKP